ncbi:MAG: CcdB family protein [Betaproteobacteria bacterium]|jgi:toxin CcdB
MPKFDAYANPIAEQRRQVPYWLDVQADFLSRLDTRVVIPLRKPRDAAGTAQRLNPRVTVDGQELYLDTANLAAVPARLLRKRVANLAESRHGVQDALDFLFTGF